MRGRTSHITAVLAVLTVVAIVTTGIALGLVRNGGPWVMLLGPSSGSNSMAEAEPLAVADSGASQERAVRSWTYGEGWEETAPPSPSAEPEVPPATTSTAGVQRSAAPAATDPAASHPVAAKEPSPPRSSPPTSIEARIEGGDSNSGAPEETQPPPESESSVDPVVVVGVNGRSGDSSAGWSASEPQAGIDTFATPGFARSGPAEEEDEGEETTPEVAAGLE